MFKKKKEIIRNKAKCLNCNDVMESTLEEWTHICSCGKLIVSGFKEDIVRIVKGKFEEQSVLE